MAVLSASRGRSAAPRSPGVRRASSSCTGAAARRRRRAAPAARRAGPSRRCGPRSSTTIASARRTVDSRCAITNDVRLRIRLASASCTSRSDSASSAEVASSRIRIGEFLSSARAIASRCRWPPDSRWPRSPMTRLVAVGQRGDELVRVRRARRRLDAPRGRAPARRTRCCAAMVSSNSTVSCVTMPICARSDASVTSRMSRPSIRMAPPVTS